VQEWAQLRPTPKMANALKQLLNDGSVNMATKPGLYANIHAKQARIKAGSGEKMNKPGTKAAPSAKDFKDSAKTAKKK
jgi:hypothetical protein